LISLKVCQKSMARVLYSRRGTSFLNMPTSFP
jgi:hypothetical protein